MLRRGAGLDADQTEAVLVHPGVLLTPDDLLHLLNALDIPHFLSQEVFGYHQVLVTNLLVLCL